MQVHERSRVTQIAPDGQGWIVRTADGSVRARQVVVCCGGYIEKLYPRLGGAVLPIATYVMVTEPLGERLPTAMRTNAAVYDTRFAFDYYRPLADTRILWGGRISILERSGADVARLLYKDMLKVYPQLEGTRVDYAWSGMMSYGRHKMPQLGRLPEGIWYGMGFGGHGVAPTTLARRRAGRGHHGRRQRPGAFRSLGAALDRRSGRLARRAAGVLVLRAARLDAPVVARRSPRIDDAARAGRVRHPADQRLGFRVRLFAAPLPGAGRADDACRPVRGAVRRRVRRAKILSDLRPPVRCLSFVLQTGRRRAEGPQLDAIRATYLRRIRWLLACGILHGTLIWFGDILTAYALLGFWLVHYAGVRLSALRPVLWVLVGINAVLFVFYGAIVVSAAHMPLDYKVADVIDAQRMHAIYAQGGWYDIALARLSEYGMNIA
ncbi:hypothetical protein LP420_40730 [Massilia sp. B-10]|nr:hypothetical protein LP420_40730 [Massilia sp. B-10]